MDPQVVYQIQPGPYWDWRVAMDLFLGGAGVGAFLFAVGLQAAFPGRYRRISNTAAWLAPLLIITGLLFLLAKLGRPLQVWVAFTTFAPTSPLWWGGILQVVFIAGSLWYALTWPEDHPDRDHRRLGWILTPLAIGVGGYHGFLLAVVTARPLWNTGPTVIAALVSFMTTGIAAVMLVHMIRMKIAGRLVEGPLLSRFLDDLRGVRGILTATLLLQLGTFFLWWVSLAHGSLQDRQALTAANHAHGGMFWGLGIGLGLILPLLLGSISVWRGRQTSRSFEVRTIILCSLLILVGGFYFRLAVLLGGQVELPVSSPF